MALAGATCLAAALAICFYGIGASLYGARAGRRRPMPPSAGAAPAGVGDASAPEGLVPRR